jgi:hypothetical protein
MSYFICLLISILQFFSMCIDLFALIVAPGFCFGFFSNLGFQGVIWV